MPSSTSLFLGRRYFAAGSGSRLGSFISGLAIAGLITGVALLIIVLSIMNGFEREMRTRILGIVPHIQLFERGGVRRWQELAESLGSIEGVREVTPFTGFQALLNARGKIQSVQVMGLSPDHLDSALRAVLPAKAGDWLGEENDAERAPGIMLSQALATKLGASAGQRLTLIVPRVGAGNRQATPRVAVFTLAGIFDTHTAEDQALALIHLNVAGDMAGLGLAPEGLRISVDDVFDVRDIGYGLLQRLPGEFSFIDWFQTHGNLYQAIQMSRQMVGLLIFLIIAIAVFNVVSMLIMTVVDKRPAIATLKTLGADNKTILGIFLVQGTLIGVVGTLVGTLLGVAGALYVPDAIATVEAVFQIRFLNTEIYPIDYLPSALDLSDVGLVATVALGLNFFATLYPAWRAAAVKPAEVLRYE
ncbi:MAG: hypothetical protein CMK32_00445 [Porticoccaceae bacterium]|nr:hypothetical protein [Porticoccaceae bacterium]